MGKWIHKKDTPLGDRLEKQEDDGSRKIITLPMTLRGHAEKMLVGEITITEFKRKYPSYSLIFNHLSERFGNPVDALDGKKIKITIEVIE